MAEQVSALEASPNGWIHRSTSWFSACSPWSSRSRLHRALRATRLGIAGPLLIGISGVGNILAAVFPLKEDAAGETYDLGAHMVAGILFFLTSAVGLLVGLVLMGTLVIPDDAPARLGRGLGQRVLVLAILFPPRILLAVRLLSVPVEAQRTVRY